MADRYTELMDKHWPALKKAIGDALAERPKLDDIVGVATEDDSRPFRVERFDWRSSVPATPFGHQQAEADVSFAHRIRAQKTVRFSDLEDGISSSVKDQVTRWAERRRNDERDIVFDLVSQSVASGDVVRYELDAIRSKLGSSSDRRRMRLIGPGAADPRATNLCSEHLVEEVVETKGLERDHYLLTRINKGPSIVRLPDGQDVSWVREGEGAAIRITTSFFFEEGTGSIKLTTSEVQG